MHLKKMIMAMAAIGCAFFFGCQPIRSVEIQSGAPPSGRREPSVERRQPGPPDHAPAHGRRAQYRYRYYPDSRIYFAEDRGIYFYLYNGVWKFSAKLPGDLPIRLGDPVWIDSESDKPYTENERHKAKYPPGQIKKQKDHTPPGQAKKYDDDGRGKGKKKDKYDDN